MNTWAIVLMLVSFLVIWGGLIASIIHLKAAPLPNGEHRPGDEDSYPHGPFIAPRDL